MTIARGKLTRIDRLPPGGSSLARRIAGGRGRCQTGKMGGRRTAPLSPRAAHPGGAGMLRECRRRMVPRLRAAHLVEGEERLTDYALAAVLAALRAAS